MRKITLSLAVAAALIGGCGGGGTGTVGISRAQIASLLHEVGVGINNLPSHNGSRSRSVAQSGQKGGSLASNRTTLGTPSPDQYFDADYELWAEDFLTGDPNGAHTWGTHYFLDQAENQPAGDKVWTSVWNAWPMVDDLDLSITQGPMKGLWSKEHDVLNNDGSGSENGTGFTPGEGDLEYTSSWPDSGLTTLTAKYSALDQTWTQYHTMPNSGGGTDYTVTHSSGIQILLIFAADRSGTGDITGPSSALPATIVWDNTGHGTINWALGPPTQFDNWDF